MRWQGPSQSYLPALALLVFLACGGGMDATAGEAGTGGGARQASVPVRPGAVVLLTDSLHLVAGKRVGLITNHTGIVETGDGVVSTIDLLNDHPDMNLVALYSPEHGIRGVEEAGVHVDSSLDTRTGIPIHSLYGATRKPSPEMLEGVDVLLFDIQDIGVRYYTFVWTMALGLEAAGEAGIPFIVLDRPNPIQGVAVQGNIVDPDLTTFVGLYPVPMRHGLTPGEMARMLVGEFGVQADLSVAPAAGWTRSQPFEDTGLPWLAPSPNMPSTTSALHYGGTCLFEGTNLSVGRGTDVAFQIIGAPWLDAETLATRLNGLGLTDVAFAAIRFTPENPGDGKYGETEIPGIRFTASGPGYDPTLAAMAALVEGYRLHADQWEWRNAHFDRLVGDATIRERIEAGESLASLTRSWADEMANFRVRRAPYLIYR